MISKKLTNLFLISIPLFIAHGLEEYSTRFYDIYPLLNFKWAETLFKTIPQATFFTFQAMFWMLLFVMYFLLRRGKGTLIIMTFVGLIYIYEATHILSAVLLKQYTSGLITSPFLPLLGFFYWKELLKNWKRCGQQKSPRL
jgi:hypothetical protein